MTYRMSRDPIAIILLVIGVIAAGFSLWMLASPNSWYAQFPRMIAEFGDFNVHFVRDLGAAYFTFGCACIWAARTPAARIPVMGLITLFFGIHALIHVFDTLRGHVDMDHFLLDFPLTYLPAILLVVVFLMARKKAKTE